MLCYFQVYTKVNQLNIYIYPLFFRFFSHIGHYRVLSRVPCAIQQVLISYLFYIQQCVYVNPNLQFIPHPLPPGNCKFVFYMCNSISVLQISSLVPFFQTPHISVSYNICLCLTYFIQCDNLQVHPCCCEWHYFVLFYMAE